MAKKFAVNKMVLIIVIIAVIVGVASFYGGMKYAQSKSIFVSGQGNAQNLRNLSPEQRQQRMQQFGAGAGGFRSGSGQGGGLISGEVIFKDETSLVVKLSDGSSKIVFYSDATNVSKFADGSASDLEIGKNIMITGAANSDGSLTAQTIQLRPQPQN